MAQRHFVPRHILEALEARRLFSAGDLDVSFGVGGRFAQTLPSLLAQTGQILVLHDDRLLVDVHGSVFEGLPAPNQYELRRYTADGIPDSGFGNAGVVVGSLGPDCETLTGGLIEQPDGKIVAHGYNSKNHGFLVRFNPDGTLDTTFDGDGVRPLPLGETFAGFDVGPGGALYIDMYSNGAGHVYRLLPDGSPDTAFGTGGAAAYTGDFYNMKIAPDGKVLLGGFLLLPDDFSFAAASRLNADGSLDTDFGDGGTIVLPALGRPTNAISAFAFLAGGQIVAQTGMSVQRLGKTVNGTAIVHLGDDGTVDLSFNDGSGVAFLEGVGSVIGIEPDAQGRGIVVGNSGSVRLLADGTLDPTFGRVAVEIPWVNAVGAGLQTDGRLVVGLHQQFVVPRINGINVIGHGIMTYRLLTDDPAPSPIALDSGSGVLAVSGTESDDLLDLIERDITIRALRNGIGREFDVADVQRVSIAAGAGNDRIALSIHSFPAEAYGGDGSDRIAGGDGHDTLYGQGGRDFIDGGNGADLIVGGGGNDQIRGQGGADHLYGYGGDDVIEGNARNDWIVGGTGADTLSGGSGNDWLIANDGTIDHLFGDDGSDRAEADGDDLLSDVEVTA